VWFLAVGFPGDAPPPTQTPPGFFFLPPIPGWVALWGPPPLGDFASLPPLNPPHHRPNISGHVFVLLFGDGPPLISLSLMFSPLLVSFFPCIHLFFHLRVVKPAQHSFSLRFPFSALVFLSLSMGRPPEGRGLTGFIFPFFQPNCPPGSLSLSAQIFADPLAS